MQLIHAVPTVEFIYWFDTKGNPRFWHELTNYCIQNAPEAHVRAYNSTLTNVTEKCIHKFVKNKDMIL